MLITIAWAGRQHFVLNAKCIACLSRCQMIFYVETNRERYNTNDDDDDTTTNK